MPQLIPIVLAATAIAGVGLSAYGTISSAQAAKSNASASANIAADQQRQEALRKQAMELDAHRKQLEAVRAAQRARALSLSNANAQDAQYGSGLQGGYGQISGQENTNLLGISQSLSLGRQNFDINADITQQRINQASYSGQAAFGSGLTSLGNGLVSSLGPINRLAGGFGFGYGSSGYNDYKPMVTDY